MLFRVDLLERIAAHEESNLIACREPKGGGASRARAFIARITLKHQLLFPAAYAGLSSTVRQLATLNNARNIARVPASRRLISKSAMAALVLAVTAERQQSTIQI